MRLPGPVVCIVGPTASGKSSLADALACELSSSVVSVDAMQVYRGMDIGTGKTPPSDRHCPLLMVDVSDPSEDYSVALFQRDARQCVDTILESGRTPVLCGGTGLYLDAVIDEMDFPLGDVSSAARSRYETLARTEGPDAVYRLLVQRDPDSAKLIHAHNTRRVIRALELLDEGKSYARQHAGLKSLAPHYDALIWGISMSRERLYQRIDRRVDSMFDNGLVDEVKGLCARGLEGALTAKQAIGYKEVLLALSGNITMEEARELVKRSTRRYAKRQLSWLRRDGRAHWLDYDTISEDEAVRIVLEGLRQHAEGGEHHSKL